MRRSLLLSFTLLILGISYGQKERIKGNKIVSTEEFEVEGFHTIDVSDNFTISLDESSDNLVKIEADSNFQEYIEVAVQDSILTISSSKDLRRAKSLNITIFYASELKKIIANNKVDIKSLSSIKSGNLDIEANNETEVFLTIESGKLSSISNGKSKVDLHVSVTQAAYQVNENSEIKGIVTADSLKVDLYQKASAKLEGEVKSMLVRADNETDFFGEKLNVSKTSLIAEGASDCYILTNEQITIEARDKTEIFLLGEPQINITSFANESTLYKKNIDYVPSKFRLN